MASPEQVRVSARRAAKFQTADGYFGVRTNQFGFNPKSEIETGNLPQYLAGLNFGIRVQFIRAWQRP
jgi:hypothetical protein